MQNTLSLIFETLSSGDIHRSKEYEAQLQKMAEVNAPLYVSTLLEVFQANRLDPERKHFCQFVLVFLKNWIERHWRGGGGGSTIKKDPSSNLTLEMRLSLRSVLINLIPVEEDSNLLSLLVHPIARIVRFDYPQDWPNVLTDLLQLCSSHSGNVRACLRILRTLNEVIKSIISKPFPKAKQHFASVSPLVFNNLFDGFLRGTSAAVLSADIDSCQTILYTLKCMNRLYQTGMCSQLNHNFELELDENFPRFLIDSFLPLVLSISSTSNSITLYKIRKNVGKFFVRTLESYPFAFAKSQSCRRSVNFFYRNVLLPLAESRSFFHRSAGKDEEELAREERLAIQSLTLLRGVIRNHAFEVDQTDWRENYAFDQVKGAGEQSPAKKALSAHCKGILDSELLTLEFIRELCNVLLTRFISLTGSEFQKMQNDPESFIINLTDHSNWRYSLMSCSEMTFADLIIRYSEVLGPMVGDLFKVAASISLSQSSNPNDLLMKYSLYGAISSAASHLYDYVDFDAFALSYLLSEFSSCYGVRSLNEIDGNKSVASLSPELALIRMRIAQMFASWVDVRMGPEVRESSLRCLVLMMSEKCEPFLSNRLMAAKCLERCVENWDFDPKHLLPILDPCIQSILSLASSSNLDEPENILMLISLLSLVIERMSNCFFEENSASGNHLNDQNIQRLESVAVDFVIPKLNVMWQQSGSNHLIKGSLLSVLKSIIRLLGMGEESYCTAAVIRLHPLIEQIILFCTDEAEESSVYLMDEALFLWHTVLVNSPTSFSPELQNRLYPRLLDLLDRVTSEDLRMILVTLESYLLAFEPGNAVFVHFSKRLFSRLSEMLSELVAKISANIIKLVEIIWVKQSSYLVGGADSGILEFYQRLFVILSKEPRELDELYSPTIQALYFHTFSRMFLQYGDESSLLNAGLSLFDTGILRGSHEMICTRFFSNWINRFENMVSIRLKVSTSVALSNLLLFLSTSNQWGANNPLIAMISPLVTEIWMETLTNSNSTHSCRLYSSERSVENNGEDGSIREEEPPLSMDDKNTIVINVTNEYTSSGASAFLPLESYRKEALVAYDPLTYGDKALASHLKHVLMELWKNCPFFAHLYSNQVEEGIRKRFESFLS